MTDFLNEEKALCAEIEKLCLSEPDRAHELIDSLIADCELSALSRAQSAALSRICCRFLMHRKLKSRMTDILVSDTALRSALFGELNTYKYSLVFLLRRLIRLNDDSLNAELLELLRRNPYRDDCAKDYSDRWSMKFIIEETLSAPDDYLSLTERTLELMNAEINQ